MNEWSSKKQWWMDLLKGFIGFSLGSFVTLMVFDNISQEKMKGQFKWQSEYGIKIAVTRDFEISAQEYSALAANALKAAMCQETADNPSALKEWKDKYYQKLHNSVKSMGYWFNEAENMQIKDAISNFMNAQKKLSDMEYEVYVSDCKTPKGNAKIYQESRWDEYIKKEIDPLRTEYNSALRSILDIARDLLSRK